MNRRTRNRAPYWQRDMYYPDMAVSEASTWRDINDETIQPKQSRLKRLLKKGGRHGAKD